MSAVSNSVMPASSAACTTSPVRASSMRMPKLLQPSPTTETSSEPMVLVSMPRSMPRSGACRSPRQGMQCAGVVDVGFTQSGPSPLARGRVMKATTPAWCSPLNGVTVVTPHGLVSAGLSNQKPTWNVLVGARFLSGSKPKIWSSRIVLICTDAEPDEFVVMSDWYQARPKLPVKFGSGVPFARCGLRCTVNRSNPRPGLKLFNFRFIVSFCPPRVTVATAVGVGPPDRLRQFRSGAFGNRLKVVEFAARLDASAGTIRTERSVNAPPAATPATKPRRANGRRVMAQNPLADDRRLIVDWRSKTDRRDGQEEVSAHWDLSDVAPECAAAARGRLREGPHRRGTGGSAVDD